MSLETQVQPCSKFLHHLSQWMTQPVFLRLCYKASDHDEETSALWLWVLIGFWLQIQHFKRYQRYMSTIQMKQALSFIQQNSLIHHKIVQHLMPGHNQVSYNWEQKEMLDVFDKRTSLVGMKE